MDKNNNNDTQDELLDLVDKELSEISRHQDTTDFPSVTVESSATEEVEQIKDGEAVEQIIEEETIDQVLEDGSEQKDFSQDEVGQEKDGQEEKEETKIGQMENQEDEEAKTGAYSAQPDFVAKPNKKGGCLKFVIIGIIVVVVAVGGIFFFLANKTADAKTAKTMKLGNHEIISVVGHLGREIETDGIESGTEDDGKYLWYNYKGDAFTTEEFESYLNFLIESEGYEIYVSEMEGGYYAYTGYKFVDDTVLQLTVVDQAPTSFAVGFLTYPYVKEDFEWMSEVK